jgi:hypothetical protein
VDNDQTHIISFEASLEDYDKTCYDSRSIAHGASKFVESNSKCQNPGVKRKADDDNCWRDTKVTIHDFSPCNNKIKIFIGIYDAVDDGVCCNYDELCTVSFDTGNYEQYHVKVTVHGDLVSGKSGMKKCTWKGSDFYIEKEVTKKNNYMAVGVPDFADEDFDYYESEDEDDYNYEHDNKRDEDDRDRELEPADEVIEEVYREYRHLVQQWPLLTLVVGCIFGAQCALCLRWMSQKVKNKLSHKYVIAGSASTDTPESISVEATTFVQGSL